MKQIIQKNLKLLDIILKINRLIFIFIKINFILVTKKSISNSHLILMER